MNKQIINLLTVGLTLLLTACGGSKSQTPELAEQSKLGTVHTLTPEYSFTSTLAGTINYAGACASETTQAKAGENTITFNNLEWWESYNNCEITVTSDKGKVSPILKITPFRTVYPAKHPLSDTGMTLCANFPRYADGRFPAPDHNGNFAELKVGLNCDDFGVTQTEDGWDGEFVIPAGQDATHGRDALAAQNELKKVGHGHGGYDFTKLDKDGNELDYSAEEYACIRDNHTGLTWEAKTNGSEYSDLHSGKAKYLWYTSNGNNGGLPGLSDNDTYNQKCANKGRCDTDKFIKDVNLENYCGLKNWRLPTYNEIASIVNVQSADDQMDHYVENPILRYAFMHNFTSDFIEKNNYRHILSSYNTTLYFPAHVWPEHWEKISNPSGVVLVSEPSDNQEPLNNDEKYEALTEATVLDKNTGLIWTRCPATMKGDNNICDTLYYWDEALAAVQTANSNDFLGYSDWRLPSIYELTSLQAFDRIPMINQDVFSVDDIENKSFWSSTHSLNDWEHLAGIKIIHFKFYMEDILPSKLDEKHHVLLVRGGY